MSDLRQLRQLWGVARSLLEKLKFSSIKETVGMAGADMTAIAHLEQVPGGNGSTKSQLLSGLDQQVGAMEKVSLSQFLCTVCERLLDQQPEMEPQLLHYFGKLGWSFHLGQVVPLSVFDPAELTELPRESHSDLIKAAIRIRDGDLSGALSAACAAVDSATSSVYQSKGLGDPRNSTFQERVKVALRELNSIAEIEVQLVELGWPKAEAKQLAEGVKGSLNQAANVMQMLRSRMGDVHGTKPVLKPLVFNSIKWATLLTRLMTK